MKKAFWFLGILLIFNVLYFRYFNFFQPESADKKTDSEFKKPILRVALVADSHNENELLGNALRQALGKGINFVIGLGDYTNLGTMDELNSAKREFDTSGLEYFVTAGDRDGWDSRDKGTNNFIEVFSKSSQIIDRENVLFVILDNSNLYKGISQTDWELLEKSITRSKGITSTTSSNSTRDTRDTLDSRGTLIFVFTHKTPFHPQSDHIMGEDSEEVRKQAENLVSLLEAKKVDGLFSGDLHFFARFKTPSGSVKITTVGAASAERNFQGPRFAVLTVWDDYSWDVEDVEIRMDSNASISK